MISQKVLFPSILSENFKLSCLSSNLLRPPLQMGRRKSKEEGRKLTKMWKNPRDGGKSRPPSSLVNHLYILYRGFILNSHLKTQIVTQHPRSRLHNVLAILFWLYSPSLSSFLFTEEQDAEKPKRRRKRKRDGENQATPSKAKKRRSSLCLDHEVRRWPQISLRCICNFCPLMLPNEYFMI